MPVKGARVDASGLGVAVRAGRGGGRRVCRDRRGARRGARLGGSAESRLHPGQPRTARPAARAAAARARLGPAAGQAGRAGRDRAGDRLGDARPATHHLEHPADRLRPRARPVLSRFSCCAGTRPGACRGAQRGARRGRHAADRRGGPARLGRPPRPRRVQPDRHRGGVDHHSARGTRTRAGERGRAGPGRRAGAQAGRGHAGTVRAALGQVLPVQRGRQRGRRLPGAARRRGRRRRPDR